MKIQMASCFSFKFRSSSSSTFNSVRLVHLNGHVQDFDHPISAGEITGKPPKLFLCTAAQLVSAGSKPLNPETQLQPGHIYFVLPLSTLQQDGISPLDMASVVKRLTARAKSVSSESISPKTSPPWTAENGLGSVGNLSEKRAMRERARSWKPNLDTIREISFPRRSDYDIKQMQLLFINE